MLASLDQQGIRYCILRDGAQLHEMNAGGEVDLLVEERKLAEFRSVTQRLGFVELPAWGHWPHHFFVGYLDESHSWLKLDVVTQVAYGRPSHSLRTKLAADCLARRQRLNQTYVPAPEDELVTLLLHCVLDKKEFTQRHCDRLCVLRDQITDRRHIEAICGQYWSSHMRWPEVAELLDAKCWTEMLNQAPAVRARLSLRDPLGTRWRLIRDKVLRKLNRWTRACRLPGFSVAVLAPDGAGKSTVVEAIEKSFVFSTRRIYMGLYQKKLSPSRRKAGTRRGIPGMGLAGMLLKQWARFAKAQYHRAQGRLVLFDRYTYDALLPAKLRRGRLSQLRRKLLAKACPGPDLVVMLDAPGSVLFARKGEHCPEKLENQRQSYLAMQSSIPQMVVVDATDDADSVCRNVTSLIWRSYLCRYYGNQVA